MLGDLDRYGRQVEHLTCLLAHQRGVGQVAATAGAHPGPVQHPMIGVFHLAEMMPFGTRLLTLSSRRLAALRPVQFRLFPGLIRVGRRWDRGVFRGPPQLGFQIGDPASQLSDHAPQLSVLAPKPSDLRFQLVDPVPIGHTNLYMKSRGKWWILTSQKGGSEWLRIYSGRNRSSQMTSNGGKDSTRMRHRGRISVRSAVAGKAPVPIVEAAPIAAHAATHAGWQRCTP